jgi:hypothetical protein
MPTNRTSSLPIPSTPTASSLPRVPSIPTVPGTPTVSGVPRVPSLLTVPGAPTVSNLSTVPSIPSLLVCRTDGFMLTVEAGSPPVVRVAGNADLAVLPRLDPFFRQLHAEMCSSGLPEVTVDLRELYFMNSSCLKAFVSWVVSIAKLPSPSAYRVKFWSNPRLHWQQRSLKAIAAFAPNLVTIELAP